MLTKRTKYLPYTPQTIVVSVTRLKLRILPNDETGMILVYTGTEASIARVIDELSLDSLIIKTQHTPHRCRYTMSASGTVDGMLDPEYGDVDGPPPFPERGDEELVELLIIGPSRTEIHTTYYRATIAALYAALTRR